jgi:DNA-binding Lrp family transcriptional regulator
MPAINEQIRRGDDPPVRRRNHSGIVAGADAGRRAAGQPRGDPRDKAELAELSDADLLPPGCACYRGSNIVGRPHIGPHRRPPPGGASGGGSSEGSAMVHAYILIQTEVGKAASVAREISAMKGVTLAEDVTGPYDVIVRAEAETVDDLGKLVVARIQSVEGITRTLTCPVVHL